MIKKIFRTEFDLFNLSLKRTMADAKAKGIDYKGVVVDKPWGYEYLMFENKYTAVWILFLKDGAKTSMHCHPKKKTSLLVLEGGVKTYSLDTGFDLKKLDGLIIDRGVFHSTRAIGQEGAFIMEIECPPQKADLVRLRDEYGRENQGYEGAEKMSADLNKYEYIDFHQDAAKERKTLKKIIKQSGIVMHEQEDWENLKKEIKTKEFCVISFLDTSVLDSNHKTILEAGEICEGKWFLANADRLKPLKNKFSLLSVH